MEVVNLSDATITINAVSNAATVATIPCVSGEMSFSFGERSVEEFECHSGTEKDLGALKFGEGSFQVTFDADNAEASQAMLIAALKQTGDFASDKKMHISVEHNNSKGANGSKVEYDVLVKGLKVTDAINGRAKIEVSYEQVTEPVITAAA